MGEKSVRESLIEKIADLKKECEGVEPLHEKIRKEFNLMEGMIDGLNIGDKESIAEFRKKIAYLREICKYIGTGTLGPPSSDVLKHRRIGIVFSGLECMVDNLLLNAS